MSASVEDRPLPRQGESAVVRLAGGTGHAGEGIRAIREIIE